MNRAELAAEVLRIHDLIAAEPGPRGDEWNEIETHMIKAARAVTIVKFDESRQEPQPRMVDGVGLCSVHCSHYNPLDGVSREHSVTGQCLKVTTWTRSMVPCRPWVDATMQHQRDVNEAQAASWKREVEGLRCELVEERAKNEALHVRMDSAASQEPPDVLPCEHMYPGEKCGNMTACRNTSGYPLCRAHGGRKPGEVCR